MVELINIPFIYSLQFSYEKVIERLCAGLLMLSSHIPDVTSRLTDSMTLKQWGNNTMSFVSEELGENREFLTYAIPEENAA